MKLELEVLAATAIKRKKPWPRLAFIGQAQESLFLFDDQRLSAVYVPSGKTKRKIPKLHPMLPNVIVLTHTDNGHFICGLLSSGDMFLWHKDSDFVKHIHGLAELKQIINPTRSNGVEEQLLEPEIPLVEVSGDGRHLIAAASGSVFVWQCATHCNIFGSRQQTHLAGAWTQLLAPTHVRLPDLQTEYAISRSAAWYLGTQQYALSCAYVTAFYRANHLVITTAAMHWLDETRGGTEQSAGFHTDWNCRQYAATEILSRDAQLLNQPGACLAKVSHDGQLVVIAVNQANSHDNCLVFVSPSSGVLNISHLSGCGARQPTSENYRWLWVADMAWTCDDLFVACVLRQGAFCLRSRLGQSALLVTTGCRLAMGPKPFLPLHPLVTVRGGDPVREENDPLRQRFSVITHPRLPMFVCSDGYALTIMQLPHETTCLSLMKGLCMEATHHLNLLPQQASKQLTYFQSLKNSKPTDHIKQEKTRESVNYASQRTSLIASKKLTRQDRFSESGGHARGTYEFEVEPADVSAVDYDSDGPAGGGPLNGLDAGRLDFSALENLSATTDFARDAKNKEDLDVDEHLARAQLALLQGWALGATHVGMWTLEHEIAASGLAANLLRLIDAVLCTPSSQLAPLGASISQVVERCRNSGRKRVDRPLVLVLRLLRGVLHTLRWDSVGHHLMVCASQLVIGSISLLLRHPHLVDTQPRVRTLHGCYLLLKHAEKAMALTYVRLPDERPFTKDPSSQHSDLHIPSVLVYTSQDRPGHFHVTEPINGVVSVQLTGIKRMGVAWLILYKSALESHSGGKDVTKRERRKTWAIVLLVQNKLHALGIDPPPHRNVTPADARLVAGDHVTGKQLLYQQIADVSEADSRGGRGGRLLLSLLYLLLQRQDLRGALELTELLLRHKDPRRAVLITQQDRATRASLLSLLKQVPGGEKTPPRALVQAASVRHVLHSLARFMAAYFANTQLFIYPPHAAIKMPPLHLNIHLEDSRVFAMNRTLVTGAIVDQGLGDAWSSERALHYLLLAGALPEAVWLARNLGDWKTAFLLAVAAQQHAQNVPMLYNRKKKYVLPRELEPAEIMKERLQILMKSATETGMLGEDTACLDTLTSGLHDVLLAGALCDLQLVPWLMTQLTNRLLSVARRFTPLVPTSLYLPAPPMYCPQPTPTNKARVPVEVLNEVALRQEVAGVVQLMLVVLSSAHCTLPAARWFAQNVLEAVQKGSRFNKKNEYIGDVRVLQEFYFNQSSLFHGQEHNSSVKPVLTGLREMTSVLWMLHCRDKLSLALRYKSSSKKDSGTRKGVDSWARQSEAALTWARHMMAFRSTLNGSSTASTGNMGQEDEEDCETTLLGVLFSLVLELPASTHTAALLAQYCHRHDSLPAQLQEKLRWLMEEWRRLQLPDKAVGVTLARYYHKVADTYHKIVLKKRKVFGEYNELVFDQSQEVDEDEEYRRQLCIGSRPFESEAEFLRFLEDFYAVSFNKLLEQETEKHCHQMKPLLKPYAQAIRHDELNSVVHQAVTSFERKQLRSEASSRDNSPALERKARAGSGRSRRALARSNSTGRPPKSPRIMRRSASQSQLNNQSPSTPRKRAAHKSIERYARELEGAQSLESIATSVDSCDLIDDPLAMPAVDPELLENMKFDRKYARIECLLDWLNRWISRSFDFEEFFATNLPRRSRLQRHQSVLRLRMSPRLIVFSLWQLEDFFSKERNSSALNSESTEQQTSRTVLASTGKNRKHHEVIPTKDVAAKKSKGKRRPERNRLEHVIYESTGSDETLTEYRGSSDSQEIHVPVRTEMGEDRMPRLTDAQRVEARRRAQLHVPHKTLEVLLNQQYVYDLNTNQNNHNVSAVSSEAPTAPAVSTSHCGVLEPSGSSQLAPDQAANGSNVGNTDETMREMNTSQNNPNNAQPGNNNQNNRDPMSDSCVDNRAREISDPLLVSHSNDLATAVGQAFNSGQQGGPHQPGMSTGTMSQPAGGTLPFGGAKTGGGLSATTGSSALAVELRDVVRHELKKLVQAQHEGILAMLGSLDAAERQPVKKTLSFSEHKQVLEAPGGFSPAEDCTVMTAQRVGTYHVPSADDSDSLGLSESSLDVTPLPSEDLHTERSKDGEGPLTVSQLTNPPVPSRKSPRGRGSHSPLRSSNKYNSHKNGHQQQSGNGKENHSFLPHNYHSHDSHDGLGTTQMPPFRWMPLLHIPNQEPSGVRFPPIPQAWLEAPAMGPQGPGGMAGFPLLHAGYQQHEVPERDTVGGSVSWPLLHMRSRERDMPRLVPPQQLLQYEHDKFHPRSNLQVQLQAEIDKALRGRAPETGSKLLKADLEPFADRDERDNQARQKRRHTKPKGKKREKSQQSLQESVDLSTRTEATSQSTGALPASPSHSRPSSAAERISPKVAAKSEASPRRRTPSPVPQKDGGNDTVGELDNTLTATMDEGIDGPLKLHHGFAITPGMFDFYVGQDEVLGSDASNFARDQLHAQQLLQQVEAKDKARGPRKVNTAVETDICMPTVDRGTEPVNEALSRFYRTQDPEALANILPPDIYMGLRFPGAKSGNQGGSGSSRGYLNVVDIDSEAVLADIVASLPERGVHELEATTVDMQGRPIQPHPHMWPTRVPAERDLGPGSPRRRSPSPRQKSPSPRRGSPSPRRPGPDPVTAALLGDLQRAELLADSTARATTRDGVHRRLQLMDAQIDAIESMAGNMERDFGSTKLLLNTIDQIGETILPTSERYPKPRVTKQRPVDERRRTSFDDELSHLQHSIESFQRLTMSGGEGTMELQTTEPHLDTERSFSQKEAAMTSRTMDSERSEPAPSTACGTARSGRSRQPSPQRRTEKQQHELRTWMKEKRARQTREYLQQLTQLRGREPQPFTTKNSQVSTKNLEAARNERQAKKLQQQRDFSQERAHMAADLARDMLADKLQLPVDVEPETRVESHRTMSGRPHTARSNTPKRTATSARRATSASPARRGANQPHVSPIMTQSSNTTLASRLTRPLASGASPIHARKSLEFSGEKLVHVYERPDSSEAASTPRPEPPPKPTSATQVIEPAQSDSRQTTSQTAKAYKPKPFITLVRLQDPGKIRKQRDRSHKPVSYVERLSEMSTASTPRSQQPLSRPASGTGRKPMPQREGPRAVKTYQQRLAELRGTRTYTTPLVLPSHTPQHSTPPAGGATVSRRPPRQSLTYAQQLQALQPNKEHYRTGHEGERLVRPAYKARGPSHPPKTYAEQLQELQPPEPRLSMEYYARPRESAHVRSRPYASPYAVDASMDRADSPWSVDERVQHMLYSEQDNSILQASQDPSDWSLTEAVDMAMQALQAPSRGESSSYVEQVSLQELEDAVSLASDISGIIDWDQVDQIVAEME